MGSTRTWVALTTWLLLSIATVGAAAAVPDAEVEGLQMPAWLTRDSKRLPLALGTQLRSGDEIATGAGSRALLRLADGSTVKLGENARFTLNGLAQRRAGRQLFAAALGVVDGAFRFTTSLLYKYRGERDVQVKFATVTAGIRGTDLWGKSTADREIVALIEGRISLTRPGEKPITMDQPSTVYQADRGAASQPVSTLPPEVLARFAAETEMQSGAGTVEKGGQWKLYAARTRSQGEAQVVYERLREAGFAAELRPVLQGAQTVYQVRIAGVLSEADGVAMAVKLRVRLGLQDVSVSLN
jgi:hypothetical protein